MFYIGQLVQDLRLVKGNEHFEEAGVVTERLLRVRWPNGETTLLPEDDASIGGSIMSEIEEV